MQVSTMRTSQACENSWRKSVETYLFFIARLENVFGGVILEAADIVVRLDPGL
jgi:hypothetical protein